MRVAISLFHQVLWRRLELGNEPFDFGAGFRMKDDLHRLSGLDRARVLRGFKERCPQCRHPIGRRTRRRPPAGV